MAQWKVTFWIRIDEERKKPGYTLHIVNMEGVPHNLFGILPRNLTFGADIGLAILLNTSNVCAHLHANLSRKPIGRRHLSSDPATSTSRSSGSRTH